MKSSVSIGSGQVAPNDQQFDPDRQIDPALPPFEVLRRHDRTLREIFQSGWSTGDKAEGGVPRNMVGDGYDALLEGSNFKYEPGPPCSRASASRFFKNTWASLGVVYGDIGTSPIYTVASILSFTSSPAPDDVKGAVSLIIWSFFLIVILKYLILVLQTDYQGKGGVFALISLLYPGPERPYVRELLVFLACLAFSCMIADGALTPAVSVVSAISGVLIPAPELGVAFVVPISMFILLLLLLYQRFGTAIIGYSFSPIIALWFIALFGFGISWVIQAPEIFEAFNPWLGIDFIIRNQVAGWLNLSNVLLAVTGCEALYADSGHFGANPIRLSWFAVAFPGLTLNYLGQGALLLVDPSKVASPYYNMLQGPLYWPMFVLTILATIIASQAMLSAAFSLVQQALALDVCPRMKVIYTSSVEEGQVYVPAVNVILGLLMLGIIAGFQTSSQLGNAYGMSIAVIMVETSILLCFVMRFVWKWWIPGIIIIMFPILILELGFLTAACSKIPNGAWFSVVVSFVLTTLLFAWHRGRVAMNRALNENYIDAEGWTNTAISQVQRVPGLSFFFTPLPVGVPPLVDIYANHINALPSQVIITSVRKVRIPSVPDNYMCLVENILPGVWRLIITLGFRQDIDFVLVMNELARHNVNTDTRMCYVFSDPHVEAKDGSPWYHKMLLWAFKPMVDMQYSAALEFGVQSNQAIHVGHAMKC